MTMCMAFPCRRTSAGCPVCDPKPFQFHLPAPPPPGCICPPTSEQTCRNPACGRKPPGFSGSNLGASVPGDAQARMDGSIVGHPVQDQPRLSEALIKHMVDRFLMWKLPKNFSPDNGISFDPIGGKGTDSAFEREPVGTNLFTATEADAMVRHMIEGLP